MKDPGKKKRSTHRQRTGFPHSFTFCLLILCSMPLPTKNANEKGLAGEGGGEIDWEKKEDRIALDLC